MASPTPEQRAGLTYKRLSSGYHYVRDPNAHHLFAQWPAGRECTVEDVSGIPWEVSCAEFAEQAQRLADAGDANAAE